MKIVVYLKGDNFLDLLARKNKSLNWFAKSIRVCPDRMWCWINRQSGISPKKRVRILNMFRYDPLTAKYKKEDNRWFDILFETKIVYTKIERGDQ